MFGLSGAAVAGIVGTVAGGAIAANASKSAANKQVQAAGRAADISQNQFDQTSSDLAPWRSAGKNALARLDTTSMGGFDPGSYLGQNPDVAAAGIDPYQHYLQYGKNEGRAFTGMDPNAYFTASPDYQFRRNEGMRGIEQTNAARGVGRSGNALKALADYNSNLASGEFGNWWNRQAGLAGVGQNAVNSTAQFGAQNASNTGNALVAGGDARASGIMGQANSWSNSLNSGLNNYLLYNGGYFNRVGG
jgi:hypothetical protein